MDQRKKINKYRILSTYMSATNYEEALYTIRKFAIERKSFSVSALAVHGIMESYKNINLNNIVNNIDLVLPDGQPLKWGLNLFYNQQLNDRVCGPDITNLLLEKSEQNNLRVLFYGSSLETLKKMEINLKNKHINLTDPIFIPSNFKQTTQDEQIRIAKKIESYNPNIVFVGLGCPRQEYWVYENKEFINAPLIAVGAAFDYLAGNIERAPSLMQNYGLEWLYRLFQDPKRLFYRYIILNSLFMKHFIFQFFNKSYKKFHNSVQNYQVMRQFWS